MRIFNLYLKIKIFFLRLSLRLTILVSIVILLSVLILAGVLIFLVPFYLLLDKLKTLLAQLNSLVSHWQILNFCFIYVLKVLKKDGAVFDFKLMNNSD